MSGYPQNTYVGMRYVPLFDGEWDATKDYEPLTVVSIDGNSYTSRTFVPAGVSPIGNPGYWAETGNYNAQIEAYRQEVLQYNDRIQANSDAIATLHTEVSAKEKDIFSGKIVCVGDSYLQGYTSDGTVESWGEKIKKIYPNTVIIAEGGSGFHSVGQSGNTFKGLIDGMTIDNSVTLVLIGGCYNDSSSGELTKDDVHATFESAFSKFPNAKVYAIDMGIGTKLDAYGKCNTKRCLSEVSGTYRNCLFMDVTQFLKSSYSENLASDGYHPNEKGQDIICSAILNYLNGNSNVMGLGRVTLTGILEGGVTGSIYNIVFENYGESVFFRYYNSAYVSFLSTPINNTNWYASEICKIKIPYDRGKCASSKYLSIPFTNATVSKVSTGKFVPAAVWMETTNEPDLWSIRATIISDDGNGFYNGSINAFSLDPTTVALPAYAL